MAMTLTEAARWTTNEVKRGIIEQIIKDSPVLGKTPFQEIVGNALQYQRELTLCRLGKLPLVSCRVRRSHFSPRCNS